MAFNAPFSRAVRPAFGPGLSSVSPWWLSGGVDPADVVAAYQAKGVASYEVSKINLANPGIYTLTEHNGIVLGWSIEDGWSGVTSAKLKTGIAPSSYPPQGMSFILRYSNAPSPSSATQYLIGSYDAVSPYYVVGMALTQSLNRTRYSYGSGAYYASWNISGVVTMAGTNCYYNGNFLSSQSPTGTTNSELCISGSSNLSGNVFMGKIQAAAIYSSVLIGSQVLAITTAMQAL